MRAVGEILVKSAVRSDPESKAIKEKEDVFNMKYEQD
jgi:hypothetical protein